jgi:hypothetical protein
MFGFKKRERIKSVAEFFKSQDAAVPKVEGSMPARRSVSVKQLIVPVFALLVIIALAVHVEGLRSESADLKKEAGRKTAEIGALKGQTEILTAELAKSASALEATKSDVARLEKDLETEKFLRAKEAQAAARKPAADKKKLVKRKG